MNMETGKAMDCMMKSRQQLYRKIDRANTLGEGYKVMRSFYDNKKKISNVKCAMHPASTKRELNILNSTSLPLRCILDVFSLRAH